MISIFLSARILHIQLTWPINAESVTSIRKDFASGSLYGSLGEPFLATDDLDELERDALKQLKNLLSIVS